MPIVITPSGEYIDSVTGNPVNIPPQRPDFGSGSTSNREMSAMAGMMGQGGSISDEERRFLEETNRRMAPGMRPSGSGATSDMEMRAYENAIRPVVGQGAVSDMEGEMARENIPANLDMGMDSEMRVEDLSDVDKVRMLIDMGLSPQEAMEAIGREKAMEVRPQEFGVPTQDPGMGALSGVPAGNQAPMPMPMPRPEDLMQRQMPMGRDRTFNPNDMLRPDNAPNT